MTKKVQDNKRCTSYFNRVDQKHNVPIQNESGTKLFGIVTNPEKSHLAQTQPKSVPGWSFFTNL